MANFMLTDVTKLLSRYSLTHFGNMFLSVSQTAQLKEHDQIEKN